ncbi:DUF4142 domain-containing protein [Undibacterium sp. Ji42W]|uniref:DUF4142 domain-containing protein n=1 Tax=Undibacterium sp. Ji42W TaxID=3413039 RepID=UPI003BF1FFF6
MCPSNDIVVTAHREAVNLVKNASNSAQDPDVKAFALKTLPSLEHHWRMAEELQSKIAQKKIPSLVNRPSIAKSKRKST